MRPSLVTREAGTSHAVGRNRHLSATHVLVAFAVVLAFVLNILALQDRSASVLVAVAEGPIAAGSIFRTDMVRLTPIPVDFEGLSSLVDEDRLASLDGWVVARAVAADGVVDISSLVEPASLDGLRSMSIPIAISRAAGGMIVAGDRVDVIAMKGEAAEFIVTDVEVVSVPPADDSVLGARENFLVVAVDADQALELTEAMASGEIDVVRSTGAPPVGGGANGP